MGDFPLKRLDVSIGILSVIAAILCALLVQSSFHKREVNKLRSEHERQIKDMKRQHGQEIMYKEQRVSGLDQTLNGVKTALEELSFTVAVHEVDRANDMNQALRRSHQAHRSVIRLLDQLEVNYPGSRRRRVSIEKAYNQYSKSLDLAISVYSHWHRQVSALLIDISQWLPSELDTVRTQMEQANQNLLRFRRTFGTVASQGDHRKEERQAVEKHEALRRRLAALERIAGLVNHTGDLLHPLAPPLEVPE